MKITFQTRLEAIDWIVENADSEAHFEVLREQLNFNFIYTETYFVEKEEESAEIVWLDKRFKN